MIAAELDLEKVTYSSGKELLQAFINAELNARPEPDILLVPKVGDLAEYLALPLPESYIRRQEMLRAQQAEENVPALCKEQEAKVTEEQECPTSPESVSSSR